MLARIYLCNSKGTRRKSRCVPRRISAGSKNYLPRKQKGAREAPAETLRIKYQRDRREKKRESRDGARERSIIAPKYFRNNPCS